MEIFETPIRCCRYGQGFPGAYVPRRGKPTREGQRPKISMTLPHRSIARAHVFLAFFMRQLALFSLPPVQEMNDTASALFELVNFSRDSVL